MTRADTFWRQLFKERLYASQSVENEGCGPRNEYLTFNRPVACLALQGSVVGFGIWKCGSKSNAVVLIPMSSASSMPTNPNRDDELLRNP